MDANDPFYLCRPNEKNMIRMVAPQEILDAEMGNGSSILPPKR